MPGPLSLDRHPPYEGPPTGASLGGWRSGGSAEGGGRHRGEPPLVRPLGGQASRQGDKHSSFPQDCARNRYLDGYAPNVSKVIQSEPDGFEHAVQHLEPYGVALVGLIRELLREADVRVHTVNFRVKDRKSATRKISGAGDKYSAFADLHDLLGVRVITYFADEVDAVAAALVPEFEIDEDNSVDKRAALDPDRFGYLSLHYVATMTSRRARLIEYKRFADRPFELQIRSILQHAWAEIEHDLGYKAEGTPPRDVRRRFSRLAGLLELADDEFQRLREDLASYEKVVGERIADEPATLEVDQSTIAALVTSGALDDLAVKIARLFPGPLSAAIESRSASQAAGELEIFGIADIATVLRMSKVWANHVIRFAELWLGQRVGNIPKESVSRGISLFYLGYVLAAQADASERGRWLRIRRASHPDTLAERIEEVWGRVVAELGEPPAIASAEA